MSIVASTISGNTADDLGGGVYLYDTDGGPFVIERSTISGNTASLGGGLFLYGPDDDTRPRSGRDLSQTVIWAGIVSDVATIPAQIDQ